MPVLRIIGRSSHWSGIDLPGIRIHSRWGRNFFSNDTKEMGEVTPFPITPIGRLDIDTTIQTFTRITGRCPRLFHLPVPVVSIPPHLGRNRNIPQGRTLLFQSSTLFISSVSLEVPVIHPCHSAACSQFRGVSFETSVSYYSLGFFLFPQRSMESIGCYYK